MKQIHVVHIIPRLGFGGAERFVVSLAKHISSKYIRQSVITLWDDRPLARELPSTVACSVFPLDHIGYLSRRKKLAQMLRGMGADVVHTHLFSADLWGRLAAKSVDIPVVTTEHNINLQESWLWGRIKRVMKNYSRVYTAPSHAVREYMKIAYGIAPEHTRVIMHGIELAHFAKIPPASFASPYKLLMIGRVVEQKGHARALEALQKITDIPCMLTIVGEGEKKEQLMQYAKELGLGDRVMWKPATENAAAAYADADIVLAPSRWEGLGIVILEALASGRLVIASRVGGIPEIISDRENGVLVEAEDSRQLAQAIREYISNPILAKKIAVQGKRWVEKRGSVETMSKAYEDIYRKITTTSV